jgi:endogenous inhibitor of DNA gyrase (YacG/DUF329 family)
MIIPKYFILNFTPEYNGEDFTGSGSKCTYFLKRMNIPIKEFVSCISLGRGFNNIPKCPNCGKDLDLIKEGCSSSFMKYCSKRCSSLGYNTNEVRTAKSSIMKDRWKDPDDVFNSKEYRSLKSSSGIKMWRNPEVREMHVNIRINNWKDPEYRSNIINSISRTQSDPEYRFKMSELICRLKSEGKINPKSNYKSGWIETSRFGKLHYDSSYEELFIRMCDQDLSIIKFSRCKMRIPYVDENGSVRHYNPDFILTYQDGSEFVTEVKPYYLLYNERVVLKSQAAIDYLTKLNIKYLFLTEYDIPAKFD